MSTLPHTQSINGIVVSDLHIGAPYSNNVMSNVELNNALDKKTGTKFCVLLGDIYEAVNLPIKHLVKDPQKETIRLQKKVAAQEKFLIKIKSGLNGKATPEQREVAVAKIAETQKIISSLESRIEEVRGSASQEEALNNAIGRHLDHLYKLVKDHPHCKFHYVLGNHERTSIAIDAFKSLQKEIEEEMGKGHLEVTEEYVKIGDGLFVHGDQQIDPKKYNLNKNTKYIEPDNELHRSKVLQMVHDFLNKRLPQFVGEQLFTAVQCASRILRQLTPEILGGVKHVFSGHTHYPYTNVNIVDAVTKDFSRQIFAAESSLPRQKAEQLGFVGWEQYIFHNTGASLSKFKSINKSAFNPLRITLKPAARIMADNDAHIDPDYRSFAISKVEQIMTPERSAAYHR